MSSSKQEVIKREVIEGEKADVARKKVAKTAGKMLRARKEKDEAEIVEGRGSEPPVTEET